MIAGPVAVLACLTAFSAAGGSVPGDADPPGRRTPPPRPPRAPETLTKPCPASRPLGAHLELRTDRDLREYSRTMRTDVWFGLSPQVRQWPRALLGTWKGNEVVWRREASQCTDRPDPANETCRCPSKRAYGRTPVHPDYAIVYEPRIPRLSVEVPNEARDSTDVEVICKGPYSEGVTSAGTDLPVSFELGPPRDPEPEFFIAAGPCTDTPLPQRCSEQPDRHIDLELSGSDTYTVPSADGNERVEVTLRWEICCGCGVPPKGPEPELEPCGDPSVQRGLLEVAISNAQRLRDQLRPHFERFQQHWKSANQLRPKFQAYVAACASWDIANTILTGLAEGAPEAFISAFNILQQVLDQDPAVILSTGAFFGVEGLSESNDVWDLLTTLAGGAKDVANAGSVEGMRGKLEECSGTPTVDDKLYNDAKAYIDEVEKALNEVPEMGRLKTMVQQADADVVNKYAKWYAACVEHAACRGTDPARCGPAPK